MKSIGIQVNDSTDSGTFMDMRVEVQRDSDGKITKGVVVGQTLRQNMAFLLITEQGELKHNPELGIGLQGILLDDDNFLVYENKIRSQFPLDGLNLKKIRLFKTEPVVIEADYE